jgi:multimeric flavodoxin WrbA
MMAKNVVIIYSSFRKNGNSERLAKEFERGAKESGLNVQSIYLRDMKYGFCKGCFACKKTYMCIQKDDIASVIDIVANADILAFATPVYYYSVSGQLKTFLDRMNPIYAAGHKFKEVYLFATAEENESYVPEGTVSDIQGWVDCFEGVSFPKTVFCGGVIQVGDINTKTSVLKEAYDLGKSL